MSCVFRGAEHIHIHVWQMAVCRFHDEAGDSDFNGGKRELFCWVGSDILGVFYAVYYMALCGQSGQE